MRSGFGPCEMRRVDVSPSRVHPWTGGARPRVARWVVPVSAAVLLCSCASIPDGRSAQPGVFAAPMVGVVGSSRPRSGVPFPGERRQPFRQRQEPRPAAACRSCAAQIWAACVLPTCLGFWRSEYGVSYGYGLAMAASGALLLRDALSVGTPVASLHAACLVLYGARLSLFLLYREVNVQSMRKFRDKIEERAKKRGSRLSRLPFIAGCCALYAGMAAPALLTLQLAKAGLVGSGPGVTDVPLSACVLLMYAGWAVNAVGDAYKSWRKATSGADTLVTGGPFTYLRHPNYTGEQLLWTSSALAGLVAAYRLGPSAFSWLTISSLGGVALGWAGIFFVLAMATENLEVRQQEKYGEAVEYRQWVARSWPGFRLGGRKAASPQEPPSVTQ